MAEHPTAAGSRHVSVVVSASPEQVYAFAAEPDNLHRWASGLAQAQVRRDGDLLQVQSPMGIVTVQFVGPNTLGVLDHTVTLPDGTATLNPVRVVPHPEGAEIVFTVRQLAMTVDEFAHDCRTVAGDLARLAGLVEG